MILLLSALAGIAQAADLTLFAAVVARYGGGMESNPIMAALYAGGGLPLVALFKGATIFFALLGSYALAGLGQMGLAYLCLGFMLFAGLFGAATALFVLTGG